MQSVIFTSLALMAFAGNSVLCRLALGSEAIDPVSFTAIRLLSGALVLLAILGVSSSHQHKLKGGNWRAAIMLFTYAITFSLAYVSLDTATGALILFVAVHVCMIGYELWSGKKLHTLEWAGLFASMGGFIYLLSPGLATPSWTGVLLMSVAGIAWAGYTQLGKGAISPLNETALNFTRTLPFVAILLVTAIGSSTLTAYGIFLAILSGAVASGLGYAIWYKALRGLSSIQAAVFQLFVPVIAAIGGVMFANEVITSRLLIASTIMLGGILLIQVAKNTRHER